MGDQEIRGTIALLLVASGLLWGTTGLVLAYPHRILRARLRKPLQGALALPFIVLALALGQLALSVVLDNGSVGRAAGYTALATVVLAAVLWVWAVIRLFIQLARDQTRKRIHPL
jgi:hypothetical protein